jgi:hypothetical protein
MPEALAKSVRNSLYFCRVSRRTMLFIAALASSVEPSTPTVLPLSKSSLASNFNTQSNTA